MSMCNPILPLEGGWWEWLAYCDTETTARRIAEAIARVA